MRNLSLPPPRARPPSAGEFWRFSLALYDIEAVSAACLELQDRRGLDVNLLLFCCWLGALGRLLEQADIARADRALKAWSRRVIRPLRTMRRSLKADPLGMAPKAVVRLRRRIALIELEAERVAQTGLAALLPIGSDGAGAAPARLAEANLKRYVGYAGIRPTPKDRLALATLSAAVE